MLSLHFKSLRSRSRCEDGGPDDGGLRTSPSKLSECIAAIDEYVEVFSDGEVKVHRSILSACAMRLFR